jgi:hypothetical protein
MQKSVSVLLVSASLALVSCASSGTQSPMSSSQLLQNPLYAEWYYKDMVESMMNMEIQNDPLLKNPTMRAIIDDTRTKALASAQAATAKRQTGLNGDLRPVSYEVRGHVLLSDGVLYLGPDTDVVPGPSLHVFLSPVLDPLAGTGTIKFPDASAIDLGLIVSPYGPSSYVLPKKDNLPDFRSLVLWDSKLERIYAFTQLRAQQ